MYLTRTNKLHLWLYVLLTVVPSFVTHYLPTSLKCQNQHHIYIYIFIYFHILLSTTQQIYRPQTNDKTTVPTNWLFISADVELILIPWIKYNRIIIWTIFYGMHLCRFPGRCTNTKQTLTLTDPVFWHVDWHNVSNKSSRLENKYPLYRYVCILSR